MKRLFIVLALLFSDSLPAQAPVAVPVGKEPRHRLVFENEYVRVFRVSIPAHDATLLHQHDLPYVYVSIGPADFINAVAGKPEAHVVMTDGQVGYSRGGFAHIARTDAGIPFENLTIELLKPQGDPKNICAQVLFGVPEADCPKSGTALGGAHKKPLFETGNTFVDLVALGPSLNLLSIVPPQGSLIVFLGDTQIRTGSIDAPVEKVMKGDVIWVLAGTHELIWNSRGKDLSYLEVSFSSSEPLVKRH